jgi:Domain of unknown function (DUF4190)
MSYPPPGGTPDPYQPQQPYGQSYEQTPYGQDPYAAPGSGVPQYPASGAPPYPSTGQPYEQQYAPTPYGQPQYAAYGPQSRTNGLAIASLVCSLAGLVTCISAPVGVVLGHVAKRQIRQTGEQGEGLANAGLWVGYILTVLGVLLLIGWLGIIIFAVSSGATST